MITDAEVYKLKSKVLQDIVKRYEELLQKNALDETRADEILERVKKHLAASTNERRFTAEIHLLCQDFPEFKPIEKKLELKRAELIQKIGQECLEKLMENQWEKWEELTNILEGSKEDSIKTWLQKLPINLREEFMNKYMPELKQYEL